MPTCGICLDTLNAPVALICGHVFCEECIVRIIHSIKPFRTAHSCPTCRQTFSIVNMSPAFVPAHLRAYVSPSVRRLYLDHIPSNVAEGHPPINIGAAVPPMSEVLEHLQAQNASLRESCEHWRTQARTHVTARFQILEAAQATRSYANHLEKENAELKRKLELLNSTGANRTGSSDSSSSPSAARLPQSPLDSEPGASISQPAFTLSSPFLSSYHGSGHSSSSKVQAAASPESLQDDYSHPPMPVASTSRLPPLSPELSRPQHSRSMSESLSTPKITRTQERSTPEEERAPSCAARSTINAATGAQASLDTRTMGKRKRSNTAPEMASGCLLPTFHTVETSPRPLKKFRIEESVG